MNEPERYELFTIPVGEKKVAIQKDTKIKNAATFILQREDHTLGNVLKMQLLRDTDCLYSAYRMPHPLEHCIHLKVQSSPGKTPIQLLGGAISDLIEECNLLETRFSMELQRKKHPEHDAYLQ